MRARGWAAETNRAPRRWLAFGVLASLLIGCGAGAPTADPPASVRADHLLRESAAALQRLRSYHAVGMLAVGYGIDLELVRGVGARGTLTYRGLRWEVTVIDSDIYFRGAALWRATQAQAAAAELGDNWVLLRGVSGYAFQDILPGISDLIATQIFAKHHPITRVERGDYGGRPSLHLAGPGDTYDVSDTPGERLPFRWTDLREPPVHGELCGLTLDGFNSAPQIIAPASVPYHGAPQVAGTAPLVPG